MAAELEKKMERRLLRGCTAERENMCLSLSRVSVKDRYDRATSDFGHSRLTSFMLYPSTDLFMYSKWCVCPQAEYWLGALEKAMRRTVQKEIQEAVAAYEDKPRDQWLFDYPAQV